MPHGGVKQARQMLHSAVKKDIDLLVSGLTFVLMKLIQAKLNLKFKSYFSVMQQWPFILWNYHLVYLPWMKLTSRISIVSDSELITEIKQRYCEEHITRLSNAQGI